MAFRKIETHLPDLYLIEADRFGDKRGFFMEMYNQKAFESIGLQLHFVQDNLSSSSRGTIRGLHFQAPPFAQGKLVSVLEGRVLDVAVDIRKSSPTYGQSIAVELTADEPKMLYVPEGFAHGFQVLSETCLFHYKCTNFYHKASEGGIIWNDPNIQLPWHNIPPILSPKDTDYPLLKDFDSPFQ